MLTYTVPLNRITGPTVPQITLQQAMLAAAPFAAYDPAQVPFEESVLQLFESPTGFQWLGWWLRQFPDPTQPTLSFGVMVDAVTGEFLANENPLGVTPPSRPGRISAPGSAVVVAASTRRHVGRPRRDGDRFWIPVETLRPLGARVDLSPGPPQVRLGERVLSAKELGAEQRDYGWWTKLSRPANAPGWWVPVRRAAEALGWRVEWVAAKRAGGHPHDLALTPWSSRAHAALTRGASTQGAPLIGVTPAWPPDCLALPPKGLPLGRRIGERVRKGRRCSVRRRGKQVPLGPEGERGARLSARPGACRCSRPPS
ncbi:MAG: hypothetical protein HY321_13135 [Armatimonadetes bacterium]|nr:hypothetical protein [Armatimonadota bacterium]